MRSRAINGYRGMSVTFPRGLVLLCAFPSFSRLIFPEPIEGLLVIYHFAQLLLLVSKEAGRQRILQLSI